MTRHPLIKTIWVLFIALFLTVQGLSQAHAAANGGPDHTHDGVACDVMVIAAEHVVIAPTPVVPTPVILPGLDSAPAPIIRPACTRFHSRAPPPRGPPL